jgi:hypothetical protein
MAQEYSPDPVCAIVATGGGRTHGQIVGYAYVAIKKIASSLRLEAGFILSI